MKKERKMERYTPKDLGQVSEGVLNGMQLYNDVSSEENGSGMWNSLIGYLQCLVCGSTGLRVTSNGSAGIDCQGCGTLYPIKDKILDFVPRDKALVISSTVDEEQAKYWEEDEEMYRPYDHEVALGFAKQRAQYIRKNVPLSEISSALDVGSGNGMSTHCLEDDINTLFSVDLSRRLLLKNPAKIRIRSDAYKLPFRDKSVDMVYSWELLHHVERPSEVLAEMGRVARKYVSFFEPNRWNPAQVVFALLSKPDRADLRNTATFFRHEAVGAGLEVVKDARVGWFTPNATPVSLYRVMRYLPFQVPVIGLSHFFLLRSP
ncbi:class I SAM-dependent methyltransferase [Candidatus Woesearchaeota archaeon]|nr:class I SAM-dependent methyltransferase [Candidatus Woesearchaeota archaeon]